MSSSTASGGVMDGVVSLDAYLAAHEPPALLTTPKASRAKAPASAPTLRAVGARSSQYTIKLHEKYQALGIPKPDFHFVGDEQGWGGKVVFRGLLGEGEGGGDLVFEEKVAFGSKQEAKEKLSEVALGEVEKLEREGKLGNNRKGQKAKEERATKVDTEREPVVNYVGQLLEFQRSTNGPQPLYTDYARGTVFSCEITIEGHPQPFSSKEDYYTTKKAARHNAARCAVEHFKAAGQWPDTVSDVGGIKKKKKAIQPAPHNNADADVSSESPAGGSYAQQVAALAVELGLNSPMWNMTSSDGASGFHTVSCSFKDSGAFEGPIGEVRHIFGKKKAKEECARLTLEYLLGEKERRMSDSRKMMEGIAGGQGAAGVAFGQPLGESKAAEGEGLTKEKEVYWSDSDEDEGHGFEDAVEVLHIAN